MSGLENIDYNVKIKKSYSCWCCWPFKREETDETDGERERLIREKTSPDYYTAESTNGNAAAVHGAQAAQFEPSSHQESNESTAPAKHVHKYVRKIEKIEMTEMGLTKVDSIFKQFETTFISFYKCETDMLSAIEAFRAAMTSTAEFHQCLEEFKSKLSDKKIQKYTAKKYLEAVKKMGGSLGDAAKELISILTVYKELEKMPVRVLDKCLSCLKSINEVDVSQVADEEVTIMRGNIKQVKNVPTLVLSFFEYAASIVLDVISAFGDEKLKNVEEFQRKKRTIETDARKKNDEIKELDEPKPPEEIKFTSLKIPTIDEMFDDIARLVNPVIELTNNLVDAKDHLGKAMKAMSEYKDDSSKAFHDYMEELKKRMKKGEVRIEFAINNNQIQIRKVEGLTPSVVEDLESGLKAVLKSCEELNDIAPDSIKHTTEFIEDMQKISKSDITNHVTFTELPNKMLALNENRKKAQKIPGDLRFFLNFVKNLMMDINDMLQTEEEKDVIYTT